MPFHRLLQSVELLGVSIATRFPAQFLAFLDKGLLQGNPSVLGGLDDLGPSDLQKSAIDGMGDRFLLDGAIDNDPFEVGGADRLDRYRGVDGGFEEFFDPGFADGGAKASDLGRVAR